MPDFKLYILFYKIYKNIKQWVKSKIRNERLDKWFLFTNFYFGNQIFLNNYSSDSFFAN